MKKEWQRCTVTFVLAGTLHFASPVRAEEPLPPLNQVLKAVAEQGKKESEAEKLFKQFYSYTRSKVTEYWSADGELKKREEKRRTHIPKPAPVATATQAPPSSTRGGTSAGAAKTDLPDRAFEKSDFAMGEELLSRFNFTMIGRDEINGRPALVIDFKPAQKTLPERSLKDKFINKAAGRVWVDERDYAVAKADLHLTERVSVVGGLVGAVSKFTYQFLRERTEDGIWFARDVKWHLEGREIFIRKTIDYREQNTDVKKVFQSQRVAALNP